MTCSPKCPFCNKAAIAATMASFGCELCAACTCRALPEAVSALTHLRCLYIEQNRLADLPEGPYLGWVALGVEADIAAAWVRCHALLCCAPSWPARRGG